VNYITGDAEANSVIDHIAAAGGHAIAVQGDVSNEAEVAAMFEKTCAAFGTLDIVVANAGLQRDAPFEDMTLAQWNTVINVNLTGQFLCARAAVREFLRRGRRPEISRALGKIICMSSVHETIPWAGHANYAASKGGVMMLMKTIAQELAPRGIRVNGLAPGATRTPINTASWSTPEAYASLMQFAVQAHRRAGRYRARCGMACLRRQRLRQWRDAVRRWRHDIVSRICQRRLKWTPKVPGRISCNVLRRCVSAAPSAATSPRPSGASGGSATGAVPMPPALSRRA
jgi:glucose 1-dehydrogenase